MHRFSDEKHLLPLDKFILAAGSSEADQFISKSPERCDVQWRKLHAEYCATKELRLSAVELPAELQSINCITALPSREAHGLAIHLQLNPDMFSIDVNPSVARMTVAAHDKFAHTILPGSKILLPTRGQQLNGIDFMMLQGFPKKLVKGMLRVSTEPLLRDLAGNAFSVPLPMAFSLAVLMSITSDKVGYINNQSQDSFDDEGILDAW